MAVHRLDFYAQANYQSSVKRLQALQPETKAQWGSMTVAEMLHHLNLAIGSGLGYFQLEDSSNFLSRSLFKFMVLRVLKKFQKNTGTLEPLRSQGSFDFTTERNLLEEILEKGFQTREDSDWHPHTYFGRMSRKDWGRLIVIHCDHHFRQFGC